MADKSIDELKQIVSEKVDNAASWIEQISEHIMHNPESGYREFKTAQFVKEQFESMGLEYRGDIARTGVKARLKGGGNGPTVAIIGELDGLPLPGHPFADRETDAAHACGHHAQIASMLGAGQALQSVMGQLAGDVVLFAVPAEEYVEVSWRMRLRRKEEIEFLVGKAELIRLGEFDDVDMAMLTHTQSGDGTLGSVGDSHNGAVVKYVKFTGRASHAGSRPWLGVNALKAANLAMAAIDAQRETFDDEWRVRIHPILTKGGDAMTAVPADARIEMMIRGKTLDALANACEKVDRCLRAGALALSAQVEIETVSGYFPCNQDESLIQLANENIARVVGPENMGTPIHKAGSTDVGDLSYIMPVIEARSGGAQGHGHSVDFVVLDHKKAAVNPAKSMAMTVIDLLADGAAGGKKVLSSAGKKMSRDEYLERRRAFESQEVFGEIAGAPVG